MTRSELKFPLDSVENNGHVRVASAALDLYTYWSGTCAISTDTRVGVEVLAGYNGGFATWNTQSPGTGSGTTANFTGRYDNPLGSCPDGIDSIDVTDIVRAWASNDAGRIANNGLRLFALDEASNLGWKKFLSAENYVAPTLTLDYDYYDAAYGAAAQWKRLAGSPSSIAVSVQNRMWFPWTTSRYELRAWTTINGAETLIGTGQIPAGKSVDPSSWFTFDVKLQALPPGQYPLMLTMRDKSLTGAYGIEGEFWNYDVSPRNDTLTVLPASAFGVPAYTSLDGGLVNPFLGNLYYETTDVEVGTVGPELRLSRSYNSMDSRIGWFGTGWTSSFEMQLANDPQGVVLVHPDGRRELYAKRSDGTYAAPPGYNARLSASSGKFTLEDTNKTVFTFAAPTSSVAGPLTQIADEYGRKLTLTLGSDKKVNKVTNAVSGRSITFTWNSGRTLIVKATSDPAKTGDSGSRITWTYSYSGTFLQSACLATTAGPLCTTYDAGDAQMNWVKQPSGKRLFTVVWDTTTTQKGRVFHRRDNKNNTWEYVYSVKGEGLGAQHITKVTNPRSYVTTYAFNFNLQTIYVKDPTGDYKHYLYDTDKPGETSPRGFLWKSEHVDGASGETMNVVETTWDSKGNATKQVNGLGETTFMSYDANGRLQYSRDPRSSSATDNRYRTTFTYDSAGRLVKKTFPKPAGAASAPFHAWSYTAGSEPAEGGGTTPAGLLAVETDENGNVTRHFYDSKGDLRRVVEPSGLTLRYTYDGVGRRATETQVCGDCPNASSTTTTTEYDERSLPTAILEPLFDNTAAGGGRHQRKTINTYAPDGDLRETEVRDVGPGPDVGASRFVRYDYDENNRVIHTVDTERGDTYAEYDSVGNLVEVTDPAGVVTKTDYDRANRPVTVSLLDYQDDPGGEPGTPATQPRALAVSSGITYDAMGNRLRATDATGHTTAYGYDAMGRLVSTTVRNYDDRGGDFVVRSVELNELGLVAVERKHDNEYVAENRYDEMGRLVRTVEDPGGIARSTELTLDGVGNVRTRIVRDRAGNVRFRTDTAYDAANHVVSETVADGASGLVTAYEYDQRGNRTKTIDPNGNVATSVYDAADHLVESRLPAVPVTETTSDGGVTTTASRVPRSRFAYDVFGEQVRVVDASGQATTTVYDAAARTKTVTYPAYTPPGGTPVVPTEVLRYDRVGNLVSRTDRDGRTTEFRYTKLHKPYLRIDPLVSGRTARGVVHTIYDPLGRRIQEIDQENRSTHWAYDALGRVEGEWRDRLVGGVWTSTPPTVYEYDGAGNVTSITTPEGVTTRETWSPLGELLTTTRPLETGGTASTTRTYDVMGREQSVTEPGGRTLRNVYDAAGRLLSTSRYATSDSTTPVTREAYGYDGNGNRVWSQSLLGINGGYRTEYAYDAGNRLAQVVTPIDATTTATTSYGYDAAGNLTRVRVPRTATDVEETVLAYTPWHQVESVVEPSTPGRESVADRRFVHGYDAAGRLVREERPGGVAVLHAFDELGRERSVTASAGGQTAAKSFDYDLTGNLVAATALSSDGSASFGWFSYDELGRLRRAAGTAGTAEYDYDGDGRLVRRADAAGVATFTWTARNLLARMTEPLTGATLEYGYDVDGQLVRVGSSGGARREFGYDGAGRVVTDVVRNTAGTSTTSTWWSYDADGNPAAKIVLGSGVAGVGVHQYGYDRAGRLIRRVGPDNSVTEFGWDLAGNRTRAGTVTYSYNDRNQLVADSTGRTYGWSAAGRLVDDGGTAIGYDPFGRPTSVGGVAYAYDAFDRVASRDGVVWAYAGLEADVIGDGTFRISHGPSGLPVGYADGSGAHLLVADRHGDVTGRIDPDGTVVASRSFDPFGMETAASGVRPRVGFQSQYTDPASGQVKMGARWYAPRIGGFTTRDEVMGDTAVPGSLNRYGYAHSNPLRYSDPTGRFAEGIDPALLAYWLALTYGAAYFDGLRCAQGGTACGSSPGVVGRVEGLAYRDAAVGRSDRINSVLRSQMAQLAPVTAPKPAFSCLIDCDNAQLQTTGQLLDYLRHDGTGKFVFSVIDGAYRGDVNRIDGNISRKDVVAAARGEHVGDLVRGLYAEACAQDASRCAGVDDRVIAAIEATVRQAARHLEHTDNAWEGIDDERSFWESNGKAILKVAVIGVAMVGCGAVSAGTAAVACGAVAGTATNWSMHAIDGDYRFTVGDVIAGGIGAATAGAGRFARLRNARGAPKAVGAIDDASRAAFQAADDLGGFTVKAKHLPGAGGSWNKFAEGVDPYAAIQDALRSGNAQFLPNPNLPGTFRVVTDVRYAVGSRGETALRVIVTNDGRVLNAFPVKAG